MRELRDQQAKREDQIFWQLVQQVNSLKQQLKQSQQELERVKVESQTVKKAPAPTIDSQEIQRIRSMYNEQIEEVEREKEQVQGLLDTASA